MPDTLDNLKPQASVPSVVASPDSLEATQARLFDRLEAAFQRSILAATRLVDLRNPVYLAILVKTHFKVSDQVASDLVTCSKTAGELAERLHELHHPGLFTGH